MGCLIVFEGGEGSGKTTQARLLHRRLQREGHRALLLREPGGTSLGDSIRRWVKGDRRLTADARLFLFAAARAQLVAQVIRPALQGGETVVCDRFSPSTVAYQGAGAGLAADLVCRVNLQATRGLTPDLVVFLDLPVEEGLARKMGRLPDAIEAEGLAFHRRVRESYLLQAEADSRRWLVLDGTLERRVLAELIWQKVSPLLS